MPLHDVSRLVLVHLSKLRSQIPAIENLAIWKRSAGIPSWNSE